MKTLSFFFLWYPCTAVFVLVFHELDGKLKDNNATFSELDFISFSCENIFEQSISQGLIENLVLKLDGGHVVLRIQVRLYFPSFPSLSLSLSHRYGENKRRDVST